MGAVKVWELGRAEQVLNVALRRAHEAIRADAWAEGMTLWATMGARSYHRYWGLLRRDLGDPWQALRLRLSAPLPGSLAASVERRGPRGEYIRRFTLAAVSREDGLIVARLLLDFAHSHTRFDVPRPPQARLIRPNPPAAPESRS